MEPVPIRRLAALCDLTCAVLKGARSARQAASAQFGTFYEPWLPKGGAGWLAGKDVRHACIALVRQCLQACRSGVPEVWLERLLALGGHIVSRSVPVISFPVCAARCNCVQRVLHSEADLPPFVVGHVATWLGCKTCSSSCGT